MTLLNKLKRKDNLLSLLAITCSVVIAGIGIFTTYLSEGAILSAILVVLGLLATSSIIERERILETSECKLDLIHQKIDGINPDFLIQKENLPSFEDYVGSGREIFYAGGHLNGIVIPYSTRFERWLAEGRTIKFILQNPANEGLKHLIMPCITYDAESYIKQIQVSLERLTSLHRQMPKAKLYVRLSDVSPTQSVSIINGHRQGTKMCILMHMPNGDAGTGPFFSLRHDRDNMWFKLFYDRYYKHLWSTAKDYAWPSNH